MVRDELRLSWSGEVYLDKAVESGRSVMLIVRASVMVVRAL